MRLLLAFCLAISCASALAQAQTAAVIDGVQLPAWRERDGNRAPLVPGMSLRAGDRIITGKDARVLVKLSEGSMVKLGENGRLVLTEVKPSQDLFKAALQVLEGAFRFTTDLATKARKREVTVAIDQVTIGIRGTDFWGRSRADRQIVCLIEGAIQVGAAGEKPVNMDKARQFYQRDKGKTLPVGLVDAKQLQQWSLETEIADGKGALRRGGRFSVQLASAGKEDPALRAVRDQVRAAGYPAEIAQRKQADKLTYIVRIRQLPSLEEAQALAAQLRGRYGVKDPVVSQ